MNKSQPRTPLPAMSSIRPRLIIGFVILLAVGLAGYGVLFHTVVDRWLAPDALALAKDKRYAWAVG